MNGTDGFKSLIYAVRLPVLGRLAGRLALVLAFLCVPSLLVAVWYGEYVYLEAFAPVILVLLALARLSWHLPEPRQLLRSEGFVLTCGAFILTPLLMAVALWPSGLSWSDRILETVSAVTTTGLSTVQHVQGMSHTFLFTRSWMQWYGGLGVVVLSVAFLMPRSLAVSQLLELPDGQDLVLAVGVYARRILQVYLALTVLAVAVCWLCFGDFFSGLVHGFSAISTGGFSSRNDSLASLSFPAQLGVMLVGMLGAVSLAVYLRMRQRAWRSIADNEELRFFIWLSVVLCAVLVLVSLLHHHRSEGEDWDNGIIMGLSAISTTGFANTSVATLSDTFKVLLMVGMFLGGCLGSTAGGFKAFRLLVVWQLLLTALRRTSAPQHAVIEPRLQGKVLTQDQIQAAMLIGTLLVALCLLSWLPFLWYGYDPVNALFEVVSAVGTVGLSSGITSPDLELPLKIVLCVDMVAGRVEVFALLCLFYPGLWWGHKNPVS